MIGENTNRSASHNAHGQPQQHADEYIEQVIIDTQIDTPINIAAAAASAANSGYCPVRQAGSARPGRHSTARTIHTGEHMRRDQRR